MAIKSLTLDAKKTIKGKFDPSRAAEKEFYRALKRVAEVSGQIIDAHNDAGVLRNVDAMIKSLEDYSKLIGPWAARQSARMLQTVAKSNEKAYAARSKELGKLFREQVAAGNIAESTAALMAEQVALIKSIPLEAGQRAKRISSEMLMKAHNEALGNVSIGVRASVNTDTVKELQKELGLSTEVATSRAMLIARTETARSNALINESRATAVGSTHYRWRNSGDGAVRESHRKYHGKNLDGMIFEWSDPPTLSDGMTGHPGTFPNCRCYAEPILDE